MRLIVATLICLIAAHPTRSYPTKWSERPEVGQPISGINEMALRAESLMAAMSENPRYDGERHYAAYSTQVIMGSEVMGLRSWHTRVVTIVTLQRGDLRWNSIYIDSVDSNEGVRVLINFDRKATLDRLDTGDTLQGYWRGFPVSLRIGRVFG